MSHDDGWDGVLPTPFMLDLPRFWATRNSAGRVIVAVPGLEQVIYAEYLSRALRTRYGLEGEALEAGQREVMQQIRQDIAPPKRQPREAWWLHNWHAMV